MGSVAQTPISSTAVQQTKSNEITIMMWMIIAMVFIVIAILLAITSITLGAVVYCKMKSAQSTPDSTLTHDQGACIAISCT